MLRYRGIPIEALAEKSSFLETAYLVVYGHLPGRGQAARWEEAVMRHSGAREAGRVGLFCIAGGALGV